ncbi:hypothetical protein [Halorubrum sp. Atlit-26R]|uniref:hypothetical protein n=1 Tax=Halorubrum sp. Atlit-26R TaxID=2282128 RepID=UPI000EF1FFC4|nr:hypothetical protein [Halorubrum sp. Atlit-26R]RLM72976.1 hypothetical protein DVK07_05620 [Halorubrum sp. Atlit-26R]
MHVSELSNLAVAAATGVFAGGLLVLLFQELPTVPLSGSYIQLQVLLFFAFVGLLAALAVYSETAQGRLVVAFVLAWSVASVVGVVATRFALGSVLPFTVAAAVAGGGGAFAGRVNASARRVLFHLAALIATVLFVFGVIFVGVSVYASGNPVLVVPFVVLAVGYFASLSGVRTELAAL